MPFQTAFRLHRDNPLCNFIGRESDSLNESQLNQTALGFNEYSALKSSLTLDFSSPDDNQEEAEASPPFSGQSGAPVMADDGRVAQEQSGITGFELSITAEDTGHETHYTLEILDQTASNLSHSGWSSSGSLLFLKDENDENLEPTASGHNQEDRDQAFILQVNDPAVLEALGEDAAAATLEYKHQVYACSLENLFYDDFYGVQWAVNNEESPRQITWGYPKDTMQPPTHDAPSPIQKNFTGTELEILREAFAAWDDAVESITFEEAGQTDTADITLGWTDIDGSGGLYGHWNGTWDWQKKITDMSIRFDADDASKMDFKTSALHEIGNALGLGDVQPSELYQSVLEDPFPVDAKGPLSQFDQALAAWRYDEGLFTAEDQAEGGALALLGVNDPDNNLIQALNEAQYG